MLPEMEIRMDFTLFVSVAIEVDPRYRRLKVVVYADEIQDPYIVVIKTDLMNYHLDRETPRGELPSAGQMREMLGLIEPPPDP